MTPDQRFIKRAFDVAVALTGLICLWPIIGLTWWLAANDTGASGFFRQIRVGKDGHLFEVIKLRTMFVNDGTTVTTSNDKRITPLGAKLRRWKLDELPQLWNVLKGEMSLVGPRPDVPGFADKLEGTDRELLQLQPGITGPATLKYRNEEELLAGSDDPERFNAEVIWPDKVRINLSYLNGWSLKKDLAIIYETVFR